MTEIVEKIAEELVWCAGGRWEQISEHERDLYRHRAKRALLLAAEHFAGMAEEEARTMVGEGRTGAALRMSKFAHSIRTSVEG